MRFWLQLGWRDLSRHKRFSLFFLFNLAIGLLGFIAVGSFGNTLNRFLDENLQEMLTADLMIFSTRPFSDQERVLIDDTLGTDIVSSDQLALYSMIGAGNNARLSRIIGIDDKFPLYGQFIYEDEISHQEIIRQLTSSATAIMSRDTAFLLGVEQGGELQIGQTSYTVGAYLAKEPGTELTSFELAPNIYIGLSYLQNSGLIRFGSRVTHMQFIKFTGEPDTRQLSKNIREALDNQAGGDSDIRVFTTEDVNRQLGKISRYFFGYLGLVGVVALFLAGIASSYLFRGYVYTRIRELAILMSLGLNRYTCGLILLLQLAFIGGIAALAAGAGFMTLLPAVHLIFADVLPAGLTIELDGRSMLLALILGIVGSILFCLPVLSRLHAIRPLMLLNETVWDSNPPVSKYLLMSISVIPAIIFFILLSTFLTGSLIQALFFTGGVFFVIIFLGGCSLLFMYFCQKASTHLRGVPKIALRNIDRSKFFSSSVFITIGVGVFLMNLIPQVQKGLEMEIGQPEGMTLPTYFLIDIQEDQRDGIEAFFTERPGRLSNVSPMVRGRIKSINGEDFHQRRKQAQRKTEGDLRRTEFNFSARKDLDVSETMIAGREMTRQAWLPGSDELFEISLAEYFGQRHNVGLGDVIEVDIQGIAMKGVVVNIRKVRWNSFQPNFFMLFQPGVLDLAPKTYLAAVNEVPSENKTTLKSELMASYPNISVIDVTRTVETILGIGNRLLFSVKIMAFLATLAGLVAVFSIARNESLFHEKEYNLLKVLGAGFNNIRLIAVLEFGLMSIVASLAAMSLGFCFSYLVSWNFFDRIWGVNWQMSLLIFFGTVAVCIGTTLIALEGVIRKRALSLLH